MPELLKEVYNRQFFDVFTTAAGAVLPRFRKTLFLQQVFAESWESKALKPRMRHVSTVLKNHLPGPYHQQLASILHIITHLENAGVNGGFAYMFLPDFIEQYGLNDLKTSLQAMERITQFASCEFAIRPFLLHHQNEVMAQMLQWSFHSHPHVRRFASEGCRPRLPWAVAIPELKKDPSPIFPVLENLKKDDSLFVRKSVANNLNDIAKDHPDMVAELVKGWKGVSAETDWIIRHGCRTLLKKAHPSTYALYNLNTAAGYKVKIFKLSHRSLKIGDRLRFSFQLKTGNIPSRLRLEYAVYYQKANGKQSRKIFQLTEKLFAANETFYFEKEQRFQDFTTRKHYPGKHRLAIVINGVECAVNDFLLLP